MILRGTNIADEILLSRNKRIAEKDLIKNIYNFLEKEALEDNRILNILHHSHQEITFNNLNIDSLESHRIFHIHDIKKICIEYRMRFLNSTLYKGELPHEGIMKIKKLEKEHTIQLQGFKIMAPASVFKLQNADDPLLFVPICNQYYYLIHSWGRDLHPFRKLLMWPYRQFENFMVSVLFLSLFLTSLIPEGMFSQNQTIGEFIILFVFMFKWVTGLAIFYGVKFGKNFSSAIWNSSFSNA